MDGKRWYIHILSASEEQFGRAISVLTGHVSPLVKGVLVILLIGLALNK